MGSVPEQVTSPMLMQEATLWIRHNGTGSLADDLEKINSTQVLLDKLLAENGGKMAVETSGEDRSPR
jgi:hypothetical protein